jgi:hypothetical protein
MKLSTATKALFDDGVIGHRVIQEYSLPAALFPVVDSWNQFPSLSDENQDLLRTSVFGAPCTKPNMPITGSSAKMRK